MAKALWTQLPRYRKKAAPKVTRRIGTSKRMSFARRQYQALKAKWWATPANRVCGCGCGRPANDVHHRRGRGKWLLRTETWMSVCRECHNWIHQHPAEAMERGWMVKR